MSNSVPTIKEQLRTAVAEIFSVEGMPSPDEPGLQKIAAIVEALRENPSAARVRLFGVSQSRRALLLQLRQLAHELLGPGFGEGDARHDETLLAVGAVEAALEVGRVRDDEMQPHDTVVDHDMHALRVELARLFRHIALLLEPPGATYASRETESAR